MNNSNKKIEIISGNFFPSWTFALAFVLVVGTVVSVGYQLFFAYEPIWELISVFAVFSIVFSAIVWFSKNFFEFNPEKKECRKGFYLFGFKLGTWFPLEIGKAYVAFQRYEENVHYTYGGLYNKNVMDFVFEIRLVYPDLSFKTLVNGRDFKSVATMIQLGKMLSSIYRVEFKDYVKGIIRKESLKK